MDFYEAALSVNCSKKEIEDFENDETFQQSIKINQSLLEKDLLEDHQTVIDKCVEAGVASPLQWKLERVNPARWGNKTKIEGDKPFAGTIKVYMDEVEKNDGRSD